MTVKHPHAAILRAIADGIPVQYTPNGCVWHDFKPEHHAFPATNGSATKGRIKPAKQKGWLNVFTNGSIQMMFATREQADKHDEQMRCTWGNNTRVACIEIEFEEGQGL